jgi:2'-5' RNA ligase
MAFGDKFAAVPKKYENIDFKPPESVAKEAEKGLEYRQRSGKGGLSSQEAGKSGIGSGVQRAVNLKNRNNIAPDTIQQMLNFFSRHEKNKSIAPENKKTPWEDAGYVAWLLWGGDAGLAWAKKVRDQMDRADKESEKKASSPLALRRDYGSSLVGSWGPVLPETREASLKFSNTGNSTSAGVFIPLPEELAQQFPSLSEDSSAPHVTLLVVGDVTGREEIFLDSVRGFFDKERGPILARLAGLDYFTTQTGRVAFTRVHFSTDMGALRDRLSSHLQDAGFKVENKFPLAYTPHVTLHYSDNPDFRWKGEVPQGSWSFHSVEVWGLPKVSEIPLGPGESPSEALLRIQQKRQASQKLFRQWFGA